MLKENLKTVEEHVQEACKRAGRSREEVTLIAVSKTKPLEMLQEIYGEGVRDFGENKVQELCDKMEQLPSDIRWHMIGHLQRNKVKYIVGKVSLIHSVDTYRLAEEINIQAKKQRHHRANSGGSQYRRRGDQIRHNGRRCHVACGRDFQTGKCADQGTYDDCAVR